MTNIDHYINELRHATTVARLNYEIWWVYKSHKTRPKYLISMNTYPIFFKTSIHAHFVALITSLYTIYEKRADTFNFPTLLKKLDSESHMPKKVIDDVKTTYEDIAKPIWVKVSILRNKAFNHRSIEQTFQETFRQADISPNELLKLINVTKKLLNDISRAWNRSFLVFNKGSREDTLKLLNDLNRVHLK